MGLASYFCEDIQYVLPLEPSRIPLPVPSGPFLSRTHSLRGSQRHASKLADAQQGARRSAEVIN